MIDIEEKQPLFLENDGEEDAEHPIKPNSSPHGHLNNKSQNHHVVGSSYGNGEANGGLSIPVTNGGSSSRSHSPSLEQIRTARSLYMMKLLSAIFYAVASFLITVVNKVVLTSYK